MLQGLATDLRYTLRVLAASPGFVLVAVLSLAIGVGANSAMFSVVRTLVLMPLPVEDPEELALLAWDRSGDFSISQIGSTSYRDPQSGANLRSNFSYPIYSALRQAMPEGSGLFAFAFLRGISVRVAGQPALLAGGALADGRYFSELRVKMALGRPFGEEDDQPGAPPVAVLSHSFWMRAFGGDPSAIGRTVRVNGIPVEVVGVTGRRFRGLSMGGFFPQTEITLPLQSQPRIYARLSPDRSLFAADDVFWLRLMARVSSGIPRDRVERVLEATMRNQPSPLIAEDGHLPNLRLLSGAQGAQPVQEGPARLLYLLAGLVSIVLVIACVNLASLMLARRMSRQREVALRRALGSSRLRLARLVLLESLLLSAAGTAAGLLLMVAASGFLRRLVISSLGSGAFQNFDLEIALDPAVIATAAALGLVATAAFGLWPALRLTALEPTSWMNERGVGSSRSRLGLGSGLVALQIGVSFPLLMGAIFFLRTLDNLGAVELGFDPQGVVEFQVDPGYSRLSPDEYPRLYLELLDRLREIPGVRSATLMENALMSGIISNSSITLDGQRHMLYSNAVGPGFLETLGMRLLAGRVPGLQDNRDSPPVGAVNETAVKELFGGASPLGRTLRIGTREVRIIGVVNDTPYRRLRDPVPATLYDSALQRDGYGGHHLVLRASLPISRLEPLVREAVSQVDPDLPVPQMRSQTDHMAQTSARERIFTQLLTIFGGFALLLASIGLHGVTSHSVTRRTSEIGVRIAVGAKPGQILWLILRRVVAVTAAGLAFGLPLSWAASRTVGSLLYGVEPSDGLTIALSSLLLFAVALCAGLLPASKASSLDPIQALGTE